MAREARSLVPVQDLAAVLVRDLAAVPVRDAAAAWDVAAQNQQAAPWAPEGAGQCKTALFVPPCPLVYACGDAIIVRSRHLVCVLVFMAGC